MTGSADGRAEPAGSANRGTTRTDRFLVQTVLAFLAPLSPPPPPPLPPDPRRLGPSPCATPPNSISFIPHHTTPRPERGGTSDSHPSSQHAAAAGREGGRHGHLIQWRRLAPRRIRPRAAVVPRDDRRGDRVARGGQRLQPGRHRAPHRGGGPWRPPGLAPGPRRRAPRTHVRRRGARRRRGGEVRAAAAPAGAGAGVPRRGGGRRRRLRGRGAAGAGATAGQARPRPAAKGAAPGPRSRRDGRRRRRAAPARPPAEAARPERAAQDPAPAGPAAQEPAPRGDDGAAPRAADVGEGSPAVRRGRLRVKIDALANILLSLFQLLCPVWDSSVRVVVVGSGESV